MNVSLKFIENVKYLAKESGVKFGDIEKSIGKTLGYLSRNPNITLNDAYAISKMLNVDLDTLINMNTEIIKREMELEKLDEELKEIALKRDALAVNIERLKEVVDEGN